MPDLNELVIFVRISQLGSFSAAARFMGLPVSTVSRKLGELEARLGVSLLKRTTRKLALTEHGLKFYDSCGPHVQGLEEAEAKLTQGRSELRGTLRVSAPVSLGRGEFIDFISGFLLKHPHVQIDLSVTNQFVDMVASQVDIAVRFGELSDSGLVARSLGVSRRVLMAAPGYLKRRGAPRNPEELAEHDAVLFLGQTDGTEWRLHAGKRRVSVEVKGAVSASNVESVNELTLRGHGIALLPEPHAGAGLASGGLLRVLDGWTSAPIPVHAVYLNRKFMPAKLEVFLAELASWKNPIWRRERG